MPRFRLDDRQRDTVLCALRLLQQVHGSCAGDLTDDLESIRRNDHDDPLEMDEIDVLCERLNR